MIPEREGGNKVIPVEGGVGVQAGGERETLRR